MNTNRVATSKDVRTYYESNGHTVRISRDGRVTFRAIGSGPWLDGRRVPDYRVTDTGFTFLA